MLRQSCLSHFNTDKKKFPGPSLKATPNETIALTVTLRLNHSVTRHCWRLHGTALSLTHSYYTRIVTNSTYIKNISTTVIMSWWCNLGNGDMENHPISWRCLPSAVKLYCIAVFPLPLLKARGISAHFPKSLLYLKASPWRQLASQDVLIAPKSASIPL